MADGADPTHLQHAIGVPAGSQKARTHQDDVSAAIRLAGLITAGDDQAETMAAIRTAVHEFEHGLGPMRPNPWRLLEQVAGRLMAAPEPEDESAAVDGEPSATAETALPAPGSPGNWFTRAAEAAAKR